MSTIDSDYEDDDYKARLMCTMGRLDRERVVGVIGEAVREGGEGGEAAGEAGVAWGSAGADTGAR